MQLTVESGAVTDQQKELCAVNVMRVMLEDRSVVSGKSFEEEFLCFAGSRTYQALFDFETGLWREGPDYLNDIYQRFDYRDAK